MTSPTASAPLPSSGPARVSPNLRHAFGGVWRLTFPKLFTRGNTLLLGATLILLGLIALAFINSRKAGYNGDQLYLQWVIAFHFTFLLPVMAFISAAGTIRDEMKPGTVDYVLTRPIPRPAFLIFKFIAHVIGSQAQLLLVSGLFVGLGLLRHAPGMVSALPTLLLTQFLLVLAFAAFGFLCGVLTSRYVVIGLVYGAIIEVGVGQIPTQLNRLSMTHQVKAMLQPFVPLLPGSSPALLPPASTLATSGVLLAFALVSIALATAIFSLRELSTANEV